MREGEDIHRLKKAIATGKCTTKVIGDTVIATMIVTITIIGRRLINLKVLATMTTETEIDDRIDTSISHHHLDADLDPDHPR